MATNTESVSVQARKVIFFSPTGVYKLARLYFFPHNFCIVSCFFCNFGDFYTHRSFFFVTSEASTLPFIFFCNFGGFYTSGLFVFQTIAIKLILDSYRLILDSYRWVWVETIQNP